MKIEAREEVLTLIEAEQGVLDAFTALLRQQYERELDDERDTVTRVALDYAQGLPARLTQAIQHQTYAEFMPVSPTTGNEVPPQTATVNNLHRYAHTIQELTG